MSPKNYSQKQNDVANAEIVIYEISIKKYQDDENYDDDYAYHSNTVGILED